ncbi:MAG TPA: hypothetical protein VES79_08230 [Solirubrobacteraceae bacterium]|nr:hypothetical protein [Solirubrobacteraceae bacterium]
MGWIVTSWKTERLALLLVAEAVETAAQVRRVAERDAQRLHRAAAREAADAAAYLVALEELGVQTREAVRRRRQAESQPSDAAARVGRATLHESPLAELFRATDNR